MSQEHKPERARRRATWVWPALAVLLAAVAVLAWAWWPKVAPSAAPAATATNPASAPAAPAQSASPSATVTPAGTASVKPSVKPTKEPTQGTLPEMAPVDLKADSERAENVVVSLESVEGVAGEAKLPGEVAGPAVRITILVHNGSSAPVDLGAVVVNAYRGPERTPLETIANPGGAPFSGTVAPGGDARGVYLFGVSVADRSDVTFTVDLKAGSPASVFRGDAR